VTSVGSPTPGAVIARFSVALRHSVLVAHSRGCEPFSVPGVSEGSEPMRDVYVKLAWAEEHLAELMTLAGDYLRPGGGDDRPLGIRFDNRQPSVVVARFIAEKPLPIEISLHAGDLVHNARTALDHVLARLKDHFGGDRRSGTFPITESDADWKGRIYPRRDGIRQPGPLDGLPCSVRMLVYREQPHVGYGTGDETIRSQSSAPWTTRTSIDCSSMASSTRLPNAAWT
jgi:hypothetical protein